MHSLSPHLDAGRPHNFLSVVSHRRIVLCLLFLSFFQFPVCSPQTELSYQTKIAAERGKEFLLAMLQYEKFRAHFSESLMYYVYLCLFVCVIFLCILCILCKFCLHSYQALCWDAFIDFTWTFVHLWAWHMYSVLIACIGWHVLTFWFDFVPCAVHSTWCFITHVLAQYRLIRPDTCALFLFLSLLFVHTFLASLRLTTVGVIRLHHGTASCDWRVRWRLALCLLHVQKTVLCLGNVVQKTTRWFVYLNFSTEEYSGQSVLVNFKHSEGKGTKVATITLKLGLIHWSYSFFFLKTYIRTLTPSCPFHRLSYAYLGEQRYESVLAGLQCTDHFHLLHRNIY